MCILFHILQIKKTNTLPSGHRPMLVDTECHNSETRDQGDNNKYAKTGVISSQIGYYSSEVQLRPRNKQTEATNHKKDLIQIFLSTSK